MRRDPLGRVTIDLLAPQCTLSTMEHPVGAHLTVQLSDERAEQLAASLQDCSAARRSSDDRPVVRLATLTVIFFTLHSIRPDAIWGRLLARDRAASVPVVEDLVA